MSATGGHGRGRIAGLLAAIAGAVLIGSMFLIWYSNPEALAQAADLGVADTEIETTAWEAFRGIDLLLLLCGVAAILGGVAVAFWRRLVQRPRERTDLASVLIVAGGMATGLIVYRLIDFPLDPPLVGEQTVELGAYLGLAAAIVLLAAGVWAMFGGRPPGEQTAAPAAPEASP